MVTPLVDTLRKQGGTLYTFSSAARDLTKVFTDDRYKFSFSHFACLNLPDIKNDLSDGTKGEEKGMYIGRLTKEELVTPGKTMEENFHIEHPNHSDHSIFKDEECINILLAENLQNYVLNFETAILNGMGDNDDYNLKQTRTVSERVFFNWLQKIGAIKFKDVNDEERYLNVDTWVEDEDEFKNKTVQYIGKIDAINTVNVCGDSYDEIYLHIPGSVGGSNDVKFFAINDENYIDKIYKCNSEYIIGRNEGSERPYNLSLKAIYDNDSEKEYYGDAGYCIDFRETSYGDYTNKNNIMLMNEESTYDFEFNCVLIYYTISDSDGNNSVTNLYGVLFLEEIKPINTDDDYDYNEVLSRGYIQRYPKIAGGYTGNGNSYALKVDLKIDTLPDRTMVAREYVDVNDDYAGAIEIYTKAMLQIQNLVDKVLDDKKEINSLKNRILYLENQLSLINQIPSIENDIERINDIITYTDPVIDGEHILDLIHEINDVLRSLLAGNLPTKLSFDSSIIKSGYGISVSDDNGKIKIDNNIGLYQMIQFYTNSGLIDGSEITYDNKLSLVNNGNDINIYTSINDGNNCALLYVNGICDSNLNIYISGNWKNGQSLKIKIKDTDGEFVSDNTIKGLTTRPILQMYCNDYNINKNDIIYLDTLKGLREIEIICVNENEIEPTRKYIYDIRIK